MAVRQSSQRIAGEQLLTQLDDTMTCYQSASSFSCGSSIKGFYSISTGTHYGDFTSTRAPITCAPVIIRWDKGGMSKKTTFDLRSINKPWEKPLDELVEDCESATFGFDGKDVLDEKIRKAGKLEAHQFSTNFNPYNCGIVNTIAQELLPSIVRAGKQPAVERWGVVAELYKLNVYSGPSGMFKSHVDTPRGRTQFGSLVVCLPTEFKGGHLRVAYRGKERVFDFGGSNYGLPSINWAAFYSDCEHEVLPVTSGHRITLTYQLYVSEHVSGLVQPQFRTADSKLYPLYRGIKEMLTLSTFMKSGGILGFHCAYQYPESIEGTYFYERYPRTLKGIDAVLFTVFRALGLTVHIKPYEGTQVGRGSGDATTRFRDLISIQEDIGRQPEAKEQFTEQFSHFNHVSYVGNEIFMNVKWFNEGAFNDVGAGHHEVASPVTTWIGNEIEVDWKYSFLALLVVVPAFSERELEA